MDWCPVPSRRLGLKLVMSVVGRLLVEEARLLAMLMLVLALTICLLSRKCATSWHLLLGCSAMLLLGSVSLLFGHLEPLCLVEDARRCRRWMCVLMLLSFRRSLQTGSCLLWLPAFFSLRTGRSS